MCDKLLLIDGNNLAHRVYWTHKKLSKGGQSVSLLYGFTKGLISLKKRYYDYSFVVVWDYRSKRRLAESQEAVERGLIKSAYKENRSGNADSEEMAGLFEQIDEMREMLEYVRVFQARIDGYEADDVIYSYAKKNEGETVIVSSDHDFYQVLDDNVEIYDGLKNETWTKRKFVENYGFEPSLWVDVGGLHGDRGDNIFGVEGWGEKTACKYVKEYGTMDKVMLGVLAKEKKSKKEEKLIKSCDIIKLAKSLKQMDIVDVPDVEFKDVYEKDRIKKWCTQYGFMSIVKDLGYLF